MDNMDNSLASELLHELKMTCKRNFVLFVIALILLFATNFVWLYEWTLPEESYDIMQDSDDNGVNSFIGSDGEIIYGNTEDSIH